MRIVTFVSVCGRNTLYLCNIKMWMMEIQIEQVLRDGTATVVDVRTPSEYSGGHVPGSINIPLQELSGRMDELKSMRNIVVCCASGGRSNMAAVLMKQEGIIVMDGGSWLNLNFLINNGR